MLKIQKEWNERFGGIVNVDATFMTNYEDYPLYVFLCQDTMLKGLPIAYVLMRNETAENMEFMYDCFSKVFDVSRTHSIIIDKDLQNVELLKRYFPTANLLLCTFHVIKYLKRS